MIYRILFILLVLLFQSCSTRKKYGERVTRLHSFADSSLLRQSINRNATDYLLIREVRFASPDSSGKQHVLSLSEAHHARIETDSIYTQKQNRITEEEIINRTIQQTKVSPCFNPVHHFLFYLIVLLIILFFIKKKR